jgi:oligoribonuclease NrnB/cAMP/cGMP phosphodiesterase (DHH superfamily)
MIVVTHTDLDGICSAALFIRKFGSDIEIIYTTVNEAKQISKGNIIVDYTCDLPKVGDSINIDHHRSNYERLIETNNLTPYDRVDPKAASATDLVYTFLGFADDVISEEIRNLGHLADTANLPDEYRPLDIVLNMNNDNKTFLRELSELLAEKGKDILITTWLKEHHLKVFDIFEETHQKIQFFLSKHTQLPRILILDVRESLPNKLAKEVFRPIFNRNVAVIALLYSKSYEEPLRISFRVKKEEQENYDVSIVAEAFGGGGHRMASACSPKSNDIPNKLIQEIQKISKPNDTLQYLHF